MSNALQIQKLKGLSFAEERNNYPKMIWNGTTYLFNPSIAEFNRQNDDGGFQIVRLMTATVRLYDVSSDESGEDTLIQLFPAGIPQPQQVITYLLDNTKFRIESIKREKTGAYFRIIAHSTTAGI